jgi:hypothetical protein
LSRPSRVAVCEKVISSRVKCGVRFIPYPTRPTSAKSGDVLGLAV